MCAAVAVELAGLGDADTRDEAAARDAEALARYALKLMERLLGPLEASKTASLQGAILEALGGLVRLFPEHMERASNARYLPGGNAVVGLMRKCINVARLQLQLLTGGQGAGGARGSSRAAKYEAAVMRGALKALDSCLGVSPTSLSEEGALALWHCVRATIQSSEDGERTGHATTYAAVALLAHRAEALRVAILSAPDDLLRVHELLRDLAMHKDQGVRSLSGAALEAFLEQLAAGMLSGDDMASARHRALYEDMMRSARDVLGPGGTSQKRQAIVAAVRCVGSLAAPTARQRGLAPERAQEELRNLLSLLLPHAAAAQIRALDFAEDAIGMSCALLKAFGHLASAMVMLDATAVSAFCDLLSATLVHVPDMYRKQRVRFYSAAAALVHALHSQQRHAAAAATVSASLARRSIDLALLPSASDAAAGAVAAAVAAGGASAELAISSMRPLRSEYSGVWIALASGHVHATEAAGTRKESLCVYPTHDELAWRSTAAMATRNFTEAAVEAMEALDLRYSERSDGSSTTAAAGDDASGELPAGVSLQAKCPEDMARFLALTELVRDVTERLPLVRAPEWLPDTVKACVAGAEQHPLLSGYYHILETATATCRAAVAARAGGPDAGDQMAVDDPLDEARVILGSYLSHIAARARRYPDIELKVSCVRCALLGVPEMLAPMEASGLVVEGFHLASLHPPVATAALAALERWNSLSAATLWPSLPRVVRALTDSLGLDKAYTGDAAQLRGLRFLGSIGGECHLAVASDGLEDGAAAGASAAELFEPRETSIDLPLGEGEPYRRVGVSLERLTPEVARLAVHGVDAEVRLAACEALHGLVCFAVGVGVTLIGRGSSSGDEGAPRAAKERMDRFYRLVMPTVLELAAGTYQVAEAMFSDLSMQLVHWFTSNRDRDNPESLALLDAILDGMCNESNVRLREHSTKLLEEFMKWSLRRKGTAGESKVNAEELLRRLQLRLSDPSALRRVGACLALRRLYSVLANQRSLVDQFLLDFFPHVLTALALATESIEHNAVAEAEYALHAVTELAKCFADTFRHPKSARGRLTCTAEVIDWAWAHTHAPQRAVRSAAMKVFRGLLRGTARSGGTEEREAVATWAAKRRQDLGVVALACTVVSGLTGDEPLDARPEFIDERRRVIGQLRGVQAALHWHKWALDKGVLQPADLIAKLDEPAHPLRAAVLCIDRLGLINARALPPAIAACISPQMRACVESQKQYAAPIMPVLTEASQVLLDFQEALLSVLIPGCGEHIVRLVDKCATEGVCMALAACVFSPDDAGFTAADTLGRQNAANCSLRIVKQLRLEKQREGVSSKLLQRLKVAVLWYLERPEASVPRLREHIAAGTMTGAMLANVDAIVAGLRMLHVSDTLRLLVKDDFRRALPAELLMCSQAAAAADVTSLARLAGALFHLALALDDSHTHDIFEGLLAMGDGDGEGASSRVYGACKSKIDRWVAFNFSAVCGRLVGRAVTSAVARSLLVESLTQACDMARAVGGSSGAGGVLPPAFAVGRRRALTEEAANSLGHLSEQQLWVATPKSLEDVHRWVQQRRFLLHVLWPLLQMDEEATLSAQRKSHAFILDEFIACIAAPKYHRLCNAASAGELAGGADAVATVAHAKGDLNALQADAMAMLPAFVRRTWRAGDGNSALALAVADVRNDLPMQQSASAWMGREGSPEFLRMGRLVGGLLAASRAALNEHADASVLQKLLQSSLLRDPQHVLAPAVDEAVNEWATDVAKKMGEETAGQAAAGVRFKDLPGEVRSVLSTCLGLFGDSDAVWEGDLRCACERLVPPVLRACGGAARAAVLERARDTLFGAIDAVAQAGHCVGEREADLLTMAACAWWLLADLLADCTASDVKSSAPSFKTPDVLKRAEAAMKRGANDTANAAAAAEVAARAFAALSRAFVCLNIASPKVGTWVADRLIERLRGEGDYVAFANAASMPDVQLDLQVEMAEMSFTRKRRAQLKAAWGASTSAAEKRPAWMNATIASQAIEVAKLNAGSAKPRSDGGRSATLATLTAAEGASSASMLTHTQEQDDEGGEAHAAAELEPAAMCGGEGVLEDDALDRHPVGRSLRLIVQRLASRIGTGDATDPPTSLPEWLEGVLDVMDDNAVHLNLRLMLAKALLRVSDLLAPFSRWVFGPIARAVLATVSQAPGEEPHLNYIVRDALASASDWITRDGGDALEGMLRQQRARQAAHELVMFGCRAAWSSKCSSNRTLEDTIRALAPLVSAWAADLGLGPELVAGHFQTAEVAFQRFEQPGSSEAKKKALDTWQQHTLAALHVLSLLAREMELFAGDAADAWAPAWPRMLAAIRSKRKKVRVLAAETLGLCLAGLHARAPRADYSTLLRLARGCFTELLFGGGARGAALPAAEVIIAIAAASMHHHCIMDKTLTQALADRARGVHGKGRYAALEALRDRASCAALGSSGEAGREILLDHLMPTFRLVLDKHDPPAQLICLQLLGHLLPHLFAESDARVARAREELLPLLRRRFAAHSDRSVREAYHQMLMAAVSTGVAPLAGEVRSQLLGSLVDPDHQLRASALIWMHRHLPKDPAARLALLAAAAASAEVVARAPGIIAVLVVSLASETREWQDNTLYAREGLANATFGPGRVFTNAGGAGVAPPASLPLTPMFASLPLSQSDAEASGMATHSDGVGWILATPSIGGSGAGRLQAAAASLLPMSMSQAPTSMAPTLLASQSLVVGGTLGAGAPGGGRARASKFALRRPVRSSTFIPMLEGARAYRLRKQREAADARQASARAKAVSMFREYRPGELVDIQLSPRELFAPLARVAAMDAQAAIVLLRPIIGALREDTAAGREWTEVEDSLAAMLETSAGAPAPVALVHAAALDCCAAGRPLPLDHRRLAAASTPAGLAAGAVQIIEEMLVHADAMARAAASSAAAVAKRVRGEGGSATGAAVAAQDSDEAKGRWVVLSRLYLDLCEEESASGCLSSGGVATLRATQLALAARASGDAAAARDAVKRPLEAQRQHRRYDTHESDVWYEIDIEASQSLGRWNYLIQNVKAEIRDEVDAALKSDGAFMSAGGDVAADGSVDAVARARAEVQVLLLPQHARLLQQYVTAASHQGGDEAQALVRRWEALQGDEGAQEGGVAALERLELHASSLAAAALACKREALVPHLADSSRARVCSRLVALHPLAVRARHAALGDLEALNAAEAAARVSMALREGGGHASAAAAAATDARLQAAAPWPNGVWDGAAQWHCVVRARRAALEEAGQAAGDAASDTSGAVVDMYSRAVGAALRVGEFRSAQSALQMLQRAAKGAGASTALKRECDVLVPLFFAEETRRAPAFFIEEKGETFKKQLDLSAQRAQATAVAYKEDGHLAAAARALRAAAAARSALALLAKPHSDRQRHSLLGAFRALRAANTGQVVEAAPLLELVAAADALLSVSTGDVAARADDGTDAEGLREALVRGILRAAGIDAAAASEWMPRALSVVNTSPAARGAFAEGAAAAPARALAPWAPQLLAALASADEGGARAAAAALENIARTMPQSLYWPMCASEEALESSPEAAARAGVLRAALPAGAAESLGALGAALADAAPPHIRWKGLSESIQNKLADGSPAARAQAAALWREARQALFVRKALERRGHVTDSKNRGGTRALMWMQKHENGFKSMDRKLGSDGSGLLDVRTVKDETDFQRLCHANSLLNSDFKVGTGQNAREYFTHGPCRLAAISPALAAYGRTALAGAGAAGTSSDACVHVPGMHGEVDGREAAAVELLGAAPHARVFGSKQRPVMVTLRGSDEAEHARIVKAGEDLRMDARVQQLLRAMNAALLRDGRAARRRLEVRCYDVTPLAPQCGLVEVVDALTIKDVIRRCTPPTAPTAQASAAAGGGRKRRAAVGNGAAMGGDEAMIHALNTHYQWIHASHKRAKAAGSPAAKACRANTNAAFLAAHDPAMISDEAARNKMAELGAIVGHNALRNALLVRCRGAPEAWVAVRGRYAASLAASSIAGWVLGLGDRHQENIMVAADGSLVPIDFGYCFGAATMLLPVPELVPFRLTPTMLAPLRPQAAERAGSTLHSDAASTLRALRRARRQLVGVAEIFVREPLVDWEVEARKNASLMEKSGHDGESDGDVGGAGVVGGSIAPLAAPSGTRSYAEKKIGIFKRKLELAHPTYTLIDELALNATVGKVSGGNGELLAELMARTALGEAGVAPRAVARAAREPMQDERCFNEEACVESLLDLATDGAVLARMYCGWESWV